MIKRICTLILLRFVSFFSLEGDNFLDSMARFQLTCYLLKHSNITYFCMCCYFHAYTDDFSACLIKGVAICGTGDNDLVQLKTW